MACSASDGEEDSRISGGSGSSSGGDVGVGATTGAGGSGLTGAGGVLVDGGSGAGGGDGGSGATCAVDSSDATLVREPVDIILTADNSGSMDDELESVEENINVNFAQILEEEDVDYRLILITRHRDDDNTSICVTEPLSSLASCPAEEPGVTERFKHYSTKVESDDSWDLTLDTYEPGFGGDCLSMCDNGDMSEEDADDKYENDMGRGWSTWVRDGAKKVFLEMSDHTEDMPVDTFLEELTSMAPEHFGTVEEPTFIYHSIVGVLPKANPAEAYLPDEPLLVANDQSERCRDTTSEGVNYQELSILTEGLRFPICEFEHYDTVFQTIAEDVVVQTEVACDFEIPEPPPNSELVLDNVAVNHQRSDGTEVELGQVLTEADCQEGAFYIDAAANRINLCPEACDALKQDPLSSVQVLFKCESTIIIE